ncbi:MAG: hypothetical protein R2750_04775 [Bacteroidales bacterium]
MFTKKDWRKKGLNTINGHKGKRQVYETYQEKDPEMAEEYLKFVSKNSNATYISWDEKKKKFTL